MPPRPTQPGTDLQASRLQDQLDAITANTRGLVQPERLAITDVAVQELLASGIESQILPVGATAPSFTLQDALTKKAVASADLLAVGTLVVKFFRGRWCPYCMTELETWQQLYPTLRARGALFVAISPQMLRQNDFTVQQHELTFPVLSDPGARTAAAFGAAYTVSEAMRAHYRSILINIPFLHGDQGESTWRLPIPATFVIKPAVASSHPMQDGSMVDPSNVSSQSEQDAYIVTPPNVSSRPEHDGPIVMRSGETRFSTADAQGTILYSEVHADHRVRPEPQDILAAL